MHILRLYVCTSIRKDERRYRNLLNKGKKAWFAIQRSLQKSKAKTVKTYPKLIDTLIKPIILYACEAWGDIRTKISLKIKLKNFNFAFSENGKYEIEKYLSLKSFENR